MTWKKPIPHISTRRNYSIIIDNGREEDIPVLVALLGSVTGAQPSIKYGGVGAYNFKQEIQGLIVDFGALQGDEFEALARGAVLAYYYLEANNAIRWEYIAKVKAGIP